MAGAHLLRGQQPEDARPQRITEEVHAASAASSFRGSSTCCCPYGDGAPSHSPAGGRSGSRRFTSVDAGAGGAADRIAASIMVSKIVPVRRPARLMR
jgi:hypothetical protein